MIRFYIRTFSHFFRDLIFDFSQNPQGFRICDRNSFIDSSRDCCFRDISRHSIKNFSQDSFIDSSWNFFMDFFNLTDYSGDCISDSPRKYDFFIFPRIIPLQIFNGISLGISGVFSDLYLSLFILLLYWFLIWFLPTGIPPWISSSISPEILLWIPFGIFSGFLSMNCLKFFQKHFPAFQDSLRNFVRDSEWDYFTDYLQNSIRDFFSIQPGFPAVIP